jgi:hypothetical protein
MDANANAMQKRWPPTEEKEYRKQEPAKKAWRREWKPRWFHSSLE